MGNMTGINFYVPDVTGDDTGMAFRMACRFAIYNAKNNKELSTYVGSMLCSVVPQFRKPVETSLNEIGIRPCIASLPSHAHKHNSGF